jgi:hypothetical protein
VTPQSCPVRDINSASLPLAEFVFARLSRLWVMSPRNTRPLKIGFPTRPQVGHH